jgi:hypothetical protein
MLIIFIYALSLAEIIVTVLVMFGTDLCCPSAIIFTNVILRRQVQLMNASTLEMDSFAFLGRQRL